IAIAMKTRLLRCLHKSIRQTLHFTRHHGSPLSIPLPIPSSAVRTIQPRTDCNKFVAENAAKALQDMGILPLFVGPDQVAAEYRGGTPHPIPPPPTAPRVVNRVVRSQRSDRQALDSLS